MDFVALRLERELALLEFVGGVGTSRSVQGSWLDLRASMAIDAGARTNPGESFCARLAAIARARAAADVRVLVGPVHWLVGFLAAVEECSGSGPAGVAWPHLGVVVGTTRTPGLCRVFIEHCLVRLHRPPTVFLAGYEGPAGDLLALEEVPRDGYFRWRENASESVAFAPASGGIAPPLLLHEVIPDVEYEVCRRGAPAEPPQRTGRWVRFITTAPPTFVAVQPAPTKIRGSLAHAAPLASPSNVSISWRN